MYEKQHLQKDKVGLQQNPWKMTKTKFQLATDTATSFKAEFAQLCFAFI